MIQQTSLSAYIFIKENGSLNKQCKILYNLYLSVHPQVLADQEVVNLLGWPINIVTARRNNLNDKGLIDVSPHKKVNPHSGRQVNAYTVKY